MYQLDYLLQNPFTYKSSKIGIPKVSVVFYRILKGGISVGFKRVHMKNHFYLKIIVFHISKSFVFSLSMDQIVE